MTLLYGALSLIVVATFALTLVWLGYPLAVRWWSAMRSRPIQPNAALGATRTVTVVLATRETAPAIAARVQNLRDTEHPAHLLSVVVALDAEGAHATLEQLTSLPAGTTVVVGDQPGGKACALNAGVRAAPGEVLVFADTAQRFDRRTIPELVAHLEDHRFGAVSGALHLGGSRWSPAALYWGLEKWLRLHESRVHSSIGVTGAVYALRKECWPTVPPGTLLDDVYVPMSLVLRGLRIGFVPSAQAWDVRAFTASAESNRKVRTLTGLFQLHDALPGLFSRTNPVRGRYVWHKLARLTTPVWIMLGAAGSAGLLMHFVLIAPRVTGGVLIAITALVATVPPLRRVALTGSAWLFGTQRAVLRAVRNGLGRQWRVWNQHP